MKKQVLTTIALCAFLATSHAQVKVYRSGGGEVIFSQADVNTTIDPNNPTASPYDVNTNLRFTLFFHAQQFLNVDLGSKLGMFTGVAIRNVGFITEDLYQHVGFNHIDNTHSNWNKNTKIKRRSYSLGFPLALKLGAINKDYYIYAGGEYEWMFHYKQKMFLDGTKYKYKEWGSKRMNPWVPSFFAGVQFPGGLNLKFKYYLKDFLNKDFVGYDFGESVNYSQFERTGVWYISLAYIINKRQLEKLLESAPYERSAYLY